MELTEKELREIRLLRIQEYDQILNLFENTNESYYHLDSIFEKLREKSTKILEVENQLNKKFPNWDECPF